jgi:hypothetical protein
MSLYEAVRRGNAITAGRNFGGLISVKKENACMVEVF